MGKIKLIDDENGFIIRPEDQVLLYCARKDVNSDIKDKILSLIQDNFDWKYLLEIASKHGLIPLLYSNLSSICSEIVPDNILKELNDNFNNNVRKNLLLTGELIKILKLFKSNNINAIPYKGPLLANLAYGNINFRQFKDLDIFIPEENVKKAVNILNSNGYECQINLKNSQEIAFFKYQREYKLINIESKIPVEIKWKFPVSSFSFKSNFEDIICNSELKLTNFFNYSFPNLSNENLILILCIHNAGHYWAKLKWICDIPELIRANQGLDWPLIIDNAYKLGIARILFVNLFLSKKLFGLELPSEIEKALELDNSVKLISIQIIERILFNSDPLKLNEKLVLRLKIRENWSNGIKDVLNLMFIPTPNVIKSKNFHNIFFNMYKILRFFDLINRYAIKIFR